MYDLLYLWLILLYVLNLFFNMFERLNLSNSEIITK
jgi:hypothetical protein